MVSIQKCLDVRGHAKFMGYMGPVQFENCSHKSCYPVYNSREKSVSPTQMINEKVLTPYQGFMLKAQMALATGYFSNQVGSGVL